MRDIAKTSGVTIPRVGYIPKNKIKTLMSSTTPKGLEDHRRKLKWIIAESFSQHQKRSRILWRM